MRRAALAFVLAAIAASLSAAEPLTISLNESRTFQMMGASAAWPVDAAIVEATARDGHVTIFGRGAGRTKIMVVSITGENALDVIVTAPKRLAAPSVQTQNARTTAEVRYASATREIQTSVAMRGQKSEANVRVIHHAATPAGERAQTSVATAYYRLFSRGRELTLFDRDVDHSPLTLRNTPVRGVHYLDEQWRLHAGYTAYATYQTFFLPIERQFVAGGGYALRLGSKARITPAAFAYFGEGTVLSVVHDYRDADRLTTRTEVAYSRGFGAAAEVTYASKRDRARADVRYRGDDFAVAGPGAPRGFFADASWTRLYGLGSTVAVVLAATDAANTRVVSGSADVDHRLTDLVSLSGGASWASFGGTRMLTIPAGVRLDWARGGVGALYRYTNAGHGFRLTGRASLGRLHVSAFADRQEHAPTLDLIFAERPDLALALDELGIAATSPADIARALREHAALVELGFIEGVTIDLAPVRTQFGLDFSLLGTTQSRQQLRGRLLRNVVEGVSSRTVTTIASLAYSRRVTASTDVFASYSYWRTEQRGQAAHVQPMLEVGVRQQFDGTASFGSGKISGVVFADEDLDGRSDGTGIEAVIELDGLRSERTRPDGTFAFEGISRGGHQLVARVPDRPHAYFTTPSRVEASAGETVSFGVATTPARLNGRVVSDAGLPLAGVRVQLARGARQVSETSGDDGRFSFAAAPGEWQLRIVSESLPGGYSTADERTVVLERATPLTVELMLRAHRNLAGTGAAPNMEIEVRPGGKRIRADAEGRFLVRSLPAGEVTLVAGGSERRVTMPATPATMTVELLGSSVPRTSAEPPKSGNRWLVLLGAFRVSANAERTAARARRSGVEATLVDTGVLTIVRSGPYATRDDAAAVAARLTRGGMEAVVTSGK